MKKRMPDQWTQVTPIGGIDMSMVIEVADDIFYAALDKLNRGEFAAYIDPLCTAVDDGRHRLVADVCGHRVSVYVPGENDDNPCSMYILSGLGARLAKPGEDRAIEAHLRVKRPE